MVQRLYRQPHCNRESGCSFLLSLNEWRLRPRTQFGRRLCRRNRASAICGAAPTSLFISLSVSASSADTYIALGQKVCRNYALSEAPTNPAPATKYQYFRHPHTLNKSPFHPQSSAVRCKTRSSHCRSVQSLLPDFPRAKTKPRACRRCLLH